MQIIGLRTGRDLHPIHPTLTVVAGTDRRATAALLGEAPEATVATTLATRPTAGPVGEVAWTAPAAGAARRDAVRRQAEELADRVDRLDTVTATPFPDRAPVDRGLADLIAARARAAGVRRPTIASARTRVDAAAAHLAHAEAAARRRALAAADGAGLEELHHLLDGLQRRASTPLARRSFRRRVTTLQQEEHALLARMGFASFVEYRAVVTDPDAAPGATDRARRELAAAQAELAAAARGEHLDGSGAASVAAWLEAAMDAAGPVPVLADPDVDRGVPDEPAADSAPTSDAGADLAARARAWLAGVDRAEARRRRLDAERAELAAELAALRSELDQADALDLASARLAGVDVDDPGTLDVELAVLSALAAHHRMGGDGAFVLDGALDGWPEEPLGAALELLASLHGRPQVVVLSDDPAVARWADRAHPGRAATLRLDGRVPTRLELGTVIDLDAIPARERRNPAAPAPAGTPARRSTDARRAGEAAAGGPDRRRSRELSEDEAERYGLDLWHLAGTDDEES